MVRQKGHRISLAIRSRQLHVVDPAIAQIRSRRASVPMAQQAGAVGQEIDPGDQQELAADQRGLPEGNSRSHQLRRRACSRIISGIDRGCDPVARCIAGRTACRIFQDHRPCRKPRMTGNRPASPDIGSGLGHEDQFLPLRLSARSVIRKQTVAATRGNGRDAPIPVIRRAAVGRQEPTLEELQPTSLD